MTQFTTCVIFLMLLCSCTKNPDLECPSNFIDIIPPGHCDWSRYIIKDYGDTHTSTDYEDFPFHPSESGTILMIEARTCGVDTTFYDLASFDTELPYPRSGGFGIRYSRSNGDWFVALKSNCPDTGHAFIDSYINNCEPRNEGSE